MGRTPILLFGGANLTEMGADYNLEQLRISCYPKALARETVETGSLQDPERLVILEDATAGQLIQPCNFW
jgi:hypothetical protein